MLRIQLYRPHMTVLDRVVQIRVTRRERCAWHAAAEAERMTLSELVRDALRDRLERARAAEAGVADAGRDVQRAG